MLDLHRHDEFSFFDGSGRASELAVIARENGLTALGLTNHGNTSGLIRHYDACKNEGVKPVLGVEAYFLPKYKEKTRGYHLCLIAKDLEGYKNINTLQTLGDAQKYYNPIIDFEMLEKHHDGLIVTGACVASYSSQAILKGNVKAARKYLLEMQRIFGDDFYIEIQPYKISEKGAQEKVNEKLLELSDDLGIACILTSDSHRGRREDIDSYLKMHELKIGDNPERLLEIKETYAERYMPHKDEMQKRFVKMHGQTLGKKAAHRLALKMQCNLESIEDKVNGDIIDELASIYSLPVFEPGVDSHETLCKAVRDGLRAKGLSGIGVYKDRALNELRIIHDNEFDDYFLIVQDYVRWAKDQGIGVGPGRGSGCNCLVNYALGITDVDPVFYELDFSRFIREGKKKLPDIDIDFETERRQEVINYVIEKYGDHAVQIASYGTYKIDNLINDLVKTYPDMVSDDIKNLKNLIKKHVDSEKNLDYDGVRNDFELDRLNTIYPGIIEAFLFLHDKVKYLGTHAAGVAISNDDIMYYTAIRTDKTGKKLSSYNLLDLERCGVIKYDMLGLNTLSGLVTLREITGKDGLSYDDLKDEKIIDAFSNGDADGVFQFDKPAAQELLRQLHIDSYRDVIATNAINRPGPLSLGIPSQYAISKSTWRNETEKPVYSDIVDDTYGNILYQEQVNAIAVNFGGLSWDDADKIRKMSNFDSLSAKKLLDENYDDFLKRFSKGMKRYGYSKSDSKELFDKFLSYTFNKGHATGYALISIEEMYYKVYYTMEYWFVKLRETKDEAKRERYKERAVKDGALFFLPHVNYSPDFSLRVIEGEKVIQDGLTSLKGVGDKAAQYIYNERLENGIYKNFDNFYDRCKSQAVNSRVIDILKKYGALEFDKKKYLSRVKKYNSSLYARADR